MKRNIKTKKGKHVKKDTNFARFFYASHIKNPVLGAIPIKLISIILAISLTLMLIPVASFSYFNQTFADTSDSSGQITQDESSDNHESETAQTLDASGTDQGEALPPDPAQEIPTLSANSVQGPSLFGNFTENAERLVLYSGTSASGRG